MSVGADLAEGIFVLDTESIVTIPVLVKASKLNECLDALTDHVTSGVVSYPDQVLTECKRIADGESITTWLKAVAGSRKHHRVPYAQTVKVLASCPELIDVDASDEPSSVAVAAMGHSLYEAGTDFVIVTEDRRAQPTRLCLADACVALGFAALDTTGFLVALGLIS